jgi:hypothetical protein
MLVRWRSGDEEREHAGIQISRKGRSLAVLQHPGVAQILVRRGPRGCCGLAHCHRHGSTAHKEPRDRFTTSYSCTFY